MIAALLLRGIVVTAIVALGALLVERALAMLWRPTRFVWLGALLVATAFAGLGWLQRSASTLPEAIDAPSVDKPARAEAPRPARSALLDRWIEPSAEVSQKRWSELTVPSWLSALDRPLGALCIACSLVWGGILLASAVRLQHQRARWRPEMLDGVPVYVSHDVGPALFGIARFGIVVPSWVTALPPGQRRLIVAHEREHARAGDPVTLLAGALLVLLQPLNPFAWLCFQRLRLAIEIDCDARVLARAADVRTYGELLLDVSERTLAGAAPVAALSEGSGHLERRISAMSRPAARHRALRTTAAATAALVLTAAAWRMPRLAHARTTDASSGSASAVAARSTGGRVIVRVDDLGLLDANRPPTVLVWGVGGPIRVAIGNGEMRTLTDTLRLQSLPAMRLDVTDGHAVVRLLARGRMRLGASVEGGSASRMSATSSQIIFLRGGVGISPSTDLPSEALRDLGEHARVRAGAAEPERPKVADDSLVRRVVGDHFPGALDGALGRGATVWVQTDGANRVVRTGQGREGFEPDGSLRWRGAVRMLPGLRPQMGRGGYMTWKRLRTARGDTLHVIWVRQLALDER